MFQIVLQHKKLYLQSYDCVNYLLDYSHYSEHLKHIMNIIITGMVTKK